MSSETSALLLPTKTASSSDNNIVLREQLKQASGGDGKLQKSEFKVLLLGQGISIKEAVLDDIFSACDIDGDGSLTVDEIFNYYVDGMETTNNNTLLFWDGMKYTAQKTTSSFIWWFAVAFHFAAWVGIVSFIYKEEGMTIKPEWSIVGAWFFFFGAVYFFKLLVDAESSNYDTMQKAKNILKQSVDKDPTFFDKKSGTDASMDPYELNSILEEQALYLPKSILTQIFVSIDVDNSGLITKDEIVQFAKTQKTDPTSKERQTAINKAVVRTWGFWSLICWFMGSILFLVAAHLSFAGYTEPQNLPHNTYLHLYGMGSVLYWLLAFCMIPMLTGEAKDYMESIDQMSKAFTDRSERIGGPNTTNDQLFRSLDVRRSFNKSTSDGDVNPEEKEQGQGQQSQSADGNLDVTELYDALIEEGVLIPYDTFLDLFQNADTSGDGELQVDEFTKFIANMQIAQDPWQFRVQLIKQIPYTSSFFGVLMFFIGGLFYTMGSYVDLTRSPFWYFGGAVCYGLASGKSVFGTVKDNWLHFHAVEDGKAKFKARITAVGGGHLPQVV